MPSSIATFEDFFRDTPAIPISRADGGEFYQLDAAGRSTRIWEPSRTKIQPGAVYWILCRDATDYAGPLRVELDHGNALEFPAAVWTRRLHIRNAGSEARTVTIRSLPSESPPSNDFANVAGPVVLDYREKDWSQGLPRDVFHSLAPQVSQTLAPGTTWTLELSPRRREMRSAPTDALWQSLLEVSDGATVRQLVGVVAE